MRSRTLERPSPFRSTPVAEDDPQPGRAGTPHRSPPGRRSAAPFVSVTERPRRPPAAGNPQPRPRADPTPYGRRSGAEGRCGTGGPSRRTRPRPLPPPTQPPPPPLPPFLPSVLPRPPPTPHLIRSLQWCQPPHAGKWRAREPPPGAALRPALGARRAPQSAEPAARRRKGGGGGVRPASRPARLQRSPSPFLFPAEEKLVHCGSTKSRGPAPAGPACADRQLRGRGAGGAAPRRKDTGGTKPSPLVNKGGLLWARVPSDIAARSRASLRQCRGSRYVAGGRLLFPGTRGRRFGTGGAAPGSFVAVLGHVGNGPLGAGAERSPAARRDACGLGQALLRAARGTETRRWAQLLHGALPFWERSPTAAPVGVAGTAGWNGPRAARVPRAGALGQGSLS